MSTKKGFKIKLFQLLILVFILVCSFFIGVKKVQAQPFCQYNMTGYIDCVERFNQRYDIINASKVNHPRCTSAHSNQIILQSSTNQRTWRYVDGYDPNKTYINSKTQYNYNSPKIYYRLIQHVNVLSNVFSLGPCTIQPPPPPPPPQQPPSKPSLSINTVCVNNSYNNNTLSFSANNASNFSIWRYEGGNWKYLSTVYGNSHTDIGRPRFGAESYLVIAQNSYGTSQSDIAYSSPACTQPPPPPPQLPSNFSFSVNSLCDTDCNYQNNRIYMSADNATFYVIKYWNNGWQYLATTYSNVYTDRQPVGTSRAYLVEAWNNQGYINSDPQYHWSTPLSCPCQSLTPQLSVTCGDDKRILTWTNPSGLNLWTIYRKYEAVLANNYTGCCTFEDTSADLTKTSWYEIHGSRNGADGTWSNTVLGPICEQASEKNIEGIFITNHIVDNTGDQEVKISQDSNVINNPPPGFNDLFAPLWREFVP